MHRLQYPIVLIGVILWGVFVTWISTTWNYPAQKIGFLGSLLVMVPPTHEVVKRLFFRRHDFHAASPEQQQRAEALKARSLFSFQGLDMACLLVGLTMIALGFAGGRG